LLEAMQRELSPEMLRQGRALQILEMIATPDAMDLLRTLARQTADESLRRDAEAALQRLPQTRDK
jgi:hypothetical protein